MNQSFFCKFICNVIFLSSNYLHSLLALNRIVIHLHGQSLHKQIGRFFTINLCFQLVYTKGHIKLIIAI